MRPLLPVFSRTIGYLVIALALFLPIIMFMMGRVNDGNFMFYKECSKLLMMAGALMILFALHRRECPELLKVRIDATRNAVFLTFIFLFMNVVYRFIVKGIFEMDTSSFLIFLLLNVLCLEFGVARFFLKRRQ